MGKTMLLSAVLALAGCRAVEPGSASETATVILKNVTLVDVADGSTRSGVTLVLQGGRIASISPHASDPPPSGATVLDGTGKWVIPGLIDVHVHDASEGYLRDMLAWGVTAILLMPSAPVEAPAELARESENAAAFLPRLALSEMFAGEFPDNIFPGAYAFRKPGSVDEARRLVRESQALGYRRIKIIRDDSFQWSGEEYRVPMMPQPVYDALAAEARALDMRVYVHATQRVVARSALAAGLDAFLHGVMDAELEADDWRAMSESKVVWTPTRNALLCFGDQRGYARRVLGDERFAARLAPDERARWAGMAEAEGPIVLAQMVHLVVNSETYLATIAANTRSALEAGVPVAVGTDGGPAGISTQIELALLQEGGMTAIEVLRAATLGGAVALGRQADLGTVEVGKRADLVVLNADPTRDARNCREIEWVIKGGEVHARENPARWSREIQEFGEQDRETPAALGGVVFVGSSSIRLWSTLARDMAPIPVLNRGFGGSRLFDAITYSQQLVSVHEPSVVVVFSGTNDIAGEDAKSAGQVRDLFRQLVARLRSADEDLTICYIAITPTLAREEHIATVREANRLIRLDCDADSRLEFIDPTPDLEDADGRPDPRWFREDRLHLNEQGYAIWTRHVRPVVERLYERDVRSRSNPLPVRPFG